MRSLCLVACLVAFVSAASIQDRGLMTQFFASEKVAAPVTNSTSNHTTNATEAVNASPVIVTHGSGGKKIQITITKEFAAHAVPAHPAAHNAHIGAGAHAHNHANLAAHGTAAASQLHIDNNAFLIDNATVTDVLQKLLSGNIQNVQAHGTPLVVPPGGKPVAVVFSSSLHVVDLGVLRPPNAALPTVAAETHGHQHAMPAHHNHTMPAHAAANHTAAGHAVFNHTALLESIMSPLMSLTHLGGGAHASVQTVAAAPVVSQAPFMQPVVVMMPVPQNFQGLQGFPASSVQVDADAQLGNVLQGILKAKQQLLESSVAAHPVPSPAPVAHAPVAHPIHAPVVVPTANVAAGSGVQVQSVPIKKIDISITKNHI